MPHRVFLPFGPPPDWEDLTPAQQALVEDEQFERNDWYRRVDAKSAS